MEVILDTNFIISCVRKGIDFVDELRLLGFKIVVPREVVEEMRDLRIEKKTGHDERFAIDVALSIIEKDKLSKKKIGGKYVDDGLIAYGKQGIYIATLDKAIQRQVPNKVVILSSKKRLEIVRN